MIELSVTQVLRAIAPTFVLAPAGDARLTGVSTDTRSLRQGEAYFGIRGERFDGGAFAHSAADARAALVVFEDGPGRRAEAARIHAARGVACALVEDATAAFGALAAYVRSRLNVTTIAITGSCGKTSTKAIAAALLGASQRVVSSPASFNNAVGVPHTLLLANDDTEALVLEVGTNAPGEIAGLAAIAQPDVALITMIGRSHLAGLGSKDGVAEEKADLFRSLRPGGTAIVNLDDAMAPQLLRAVPRHARVVTFSAKGDARAEARADDVVLDADGGSFELVIGDERRRVQIPLLGAQACTNTLAALAIVHVTGSDLDRAVQAARTLEAGAHRLAKVEVGGVTVIDDTYNANPESMLTALDLVRPGRGRGGRRVFVAGAMGELGDASVELHRELGQSIADAGLDRLVLVGDDDVWAELDAVEAVVRHACDVERFTDPIAVAQRLGTWLEPGDCVVLKASRAQRLERILEPLVERLASRTEQGVAP